ncbi:MAG: HEPN domain-containing protein [Planctomycetia bacterium]|nr:HEPN domain-containing protein [Planctomycetia bacterium]
MLRRELQRLARTRIKEARRLIAAAEYSGAYYLCGLAVECALKASIAKQTQRHEFPDKRRAQEAWDHDLVRLAKVAGLTQAIEHEVQLKTPFGRNWTLVKDWEIESRYNFWTRDDAKNLYRAIMTRTGGVLRWLQQHW